jgi:SDR family mycofactocin-dependent oxidoreductase
MTTVGDGGLLTGQVALITGAARGQGRSHAAGLARAGADIIAVDLCAQPAHVTVPGATYADLEQTAKQVEALGRRAVTAVADVRDLSALSAAVADGVGALGRLDIVAANAGIFAVGPKAGQATPRERLEIWQATLDTNLTGAWNTLEASVPHILAGNRGGAIVITSSTAALTGMRTVGGFETRAQPGQVAYTVSKHALVGLMRSYAIQLAPHRIRVNCIAPTGVATPMVVNEVFGELARGHPELVTRSNALPVDMIEASDVSNALLYLVSDLGRYVTGSTLPVDAGFLLE